jgi:hypothetical protein
MVNAINNAINTARLKAPGEDWEFDMAVELKETIINHLGKNVSAVGFAPVDRFNNAPEMHHPANACRDARTVIVFGITVPQGMLRSLQSVSAASELSHALYAPGRAGAVALQFY